MLLTATNISLYVHGYMTDLREVSSQGGTMQAGDIDAIKIALRTSPLRLDLRGCAASIPQQCLLLRKLCLSMCLYRPGRGIRGDLEPECRFADELAVQSFV